MDMSKIQRALGFIEGVCAGLPDKAAELIEGAVVEIDCEIETGCNFGAEAGDCYVGLCPPRNDSGCREAKGVDRGCYTTGEMDELVERLHKHHGNYAEGHAQDYRKVCSDCRQAAEVITRLRLIIEDLEYAACAENP